MDYMFRLLHESTELMDYIYANGGSIRFRAGEERPLQFHQGVLEWLASAEPVMLRRIPDYAAKQLGYIAVYELTREGWRQCRAASERTQGGD